MLDHRYLARLLVEAKTPLAVGSGEADLLTDALICVDANGVPTIPGTSLAGVLRHSCQAANLAVDDIFGFQRQSPGVSEGRGSRLILSNACLVAGAKRIVEGLADDLALDSYILALAELPVRQHCRHNHRGAADREKRGKFDRQLLPRGVRFALALELIGAAADASLWEQLLAAFGDPAFRIGGGTRKGCGELQIIAISTRVFNLTVAKDLTDYLDQSSSLNKPLTKAKEIAIAPKLNSEWQRYCLRLTPEDYWLFGSGLGDTQADITPVYEKCVEWDEDQPRFSARQILLPATAIKGALAHRLAFNYNAIAKKFADKVSNFENYVGEKNRAVCELFGCATDTRTASGRIGRVIFSDLFLPDAEQTAIINHVAIDRFTGGARDGALFNERVIAHQPQFNLEILVHKHALSNPDIKRAWERTLDELTSGQLPLGGGVMRGHGVFKGEWTSQEGK